MYEQHCARVFRTRKNATQELQHSFKQKICSWCDYRQPYVVSIRVAPWTRLLWLDRGNIEPPRCLVRFGHNKQKGGKVVFRPCHGPSSEEGSTLPDTALSLFIVYTWRPNPSLKDTMYGNWTHLSQAKPGTYTSKCTWFWGCPLPTISPGPWIMWLPLLNKRSSLPLHKKMNLIEH